MIWIVGSLCIAAAVLLNWVTFLMCDNTQCKQEKYRIARENARLREENDRLRQENEQFRIESDDAHVAAGKLNALIDQREYQRHLDEQIGF